MGVVCFVKKNSKWIVLAFAFVNLVNLFIPLQQWNFVETGRDEIIFPFQFYFENNFEGVLYGIFYIIIPVVFAILSLFLKKSSKILIPISLFLICFPNLQHFISSLDYHYNILAGSIIGFILVLLVLAYVIIVNLYSKEDSEIDLNQYKNLEEQRQMKKKIKREAKALTNSERIEILELKQRIAELENQLQEKQ